jgi:hypothetical protein
VCDDAIGDDRLRAVPATRYCVDHELEAEILVEARGVEDVESPPEAAELAALEAGRHLGLVPEDDSEPPSERDDRSEGPEDLAVHVRRA